MRYFVCLSFVLLFGIEIIYSQEVDLNDEDPYLNELIYPEWQDSVLTVTGDYNYPPYEFINEEGEPDGFTVDIVKAVAEVMNLKTEINLQSWTDVRYAIENGKVDMVTGMYKTPARERKIDFTIPHFISSYSVFVREDSPIKLTEEIHDKVILVQKEDLGHDYVVENNMGKNIITYPDVEDPFIKLSEGVGDCVVHSRLQGIRVIEEYGLDNVRNLGTALVQQKYCMAVPEGRQSLLAVLNEGLSIIKTNGTYDRIYQEWFGVYVDDARSWQEVLNTFLWILAPLLIIALVAVLWSYSLKKQVRKKTLELKRELKKRREIQRKLEESQKQLKAQNRRLVDQNRQIGVMNKELFYAKEVAEQNDRFKTAFLANMSHEIRTPMNAIIGFCELIDVNSDELERQRYAEIISQSAQRLLHLLNDIIDISKIESGQMEINKKQVDIQPLMNELAIFYEIQARQKGIKVVFKPATGHEDLKINTDEHRIAQVLKNFLSNGVKHTNDGTIELGYDVIKDKKVRFWVKDSGCGLTQGELSQVFERFYQGKENKDGGTGLGLAIAKSIVEHLDGEIGVESEPGTGSTFWFTHPL
ncbi:MAG: transporter substrate-binding domain-containing protein [Marinilabilia sp.]